MAFGPGRYDAEATTLRETTDARAVVVIVLTGKRGDGFSVQTDDPTLLLRLPALLRNVAASIERDVQRDAAHIANRGA
jgi:hypothetical protein